MINEKLKIAIGEQFPEAILDETGQFPVISVDTSQGHDLIHVLRDNGFVCYDKLDCLSGVDWITHLEVVYHLYSTGQKVQVVVKVKIGDRENPEADSVTDMWKGADLLECEVYDFFGIRFNNHPFLRRIFLNEDWPGYPLRKDYVDEINMITL
jgi:NADH-quinone oxidoreductase subunit C